MKIDLWIREVIDLQRDSCAFCFHDDSFEFMPSHNSSTLGIQVYPY